MHLTWNRSPIMERPSPTPEVSKSLGWSHMPAAIQIPARGESGVAGTRLAERPIREIAHALEC